MTAETKYNIGDIVYSIIKETEYFDDSFRTKTKYKIIRSKINYIEVTQFHWQKNMRVAYSDTNCNRFLEADCYPTKEEAQKHLKMKRRSI